MMKLQGNKAVATLVFILCFSLTKAQSFRYQALTDSVRQTGFYSIPITPELSAHMQTDFRDVRIWDRKEKQVPYLVRSRKPKWQGSLFKPFPVVENQLDDSGRSVIVVQKNISPSISSLSFVIRNAAVSRYAALSGSNDGKNWFIISEQLLINDSYETGADSSIQSVSFPPSAYPYYRLVINNEKSDPLNIVSLGYYPTVANKSEEPYVKNKVPTITQTDSSNGISYIKIMQPENYPVSWLQLKLGGPKYYSRLVTVAIQQSGNHRQNLLQEITSFSLSSTTNFETRIPLFKAKSFYITINNGDNPPLQIQAVETGQEYHEIIAWLEKNNRYKLVMDADNAAAPNYDLQQFQDSIPATVSPLGIGPVTAVNAADSTTESAGFPRKYIWLIMIGVVALLSLLTWKLTTEMRKPTSSE